MRKILVEGKMGEKYGNPREKKNFPPISFLWGILFSLEQNPNQMAKYYWLGLDNIKEVKLGVAWQNLEKNRTPRI